MCCIEATAKVYVILDHPPYIFFFQENHIFTNTLECLQDFGHFFRTVYFFSAVNLYNLSYSIILFVVCMFVFLRNE